MNEDKVLLHEHRWFESQDAAELSKLRTDSGGRQHIRPWSTFIAAMGPHWKPGSKEAVMEMAKHTYDQGIEVAFAEIQDMCYQPFDSLGTMRNSAIERALRGGWEYILYVDNDVLPPKDALHKLLGRGVPVITPKVKYADGKDYGLTMPHLEEGKGLAVISSGVLSFLLLRVSVLRLLPGFWENALGAGEKYHFDKLEALTGHILYCDTDVVVECLAGPHFPLDHKGSEDSEEANEVEVSRRYPHPPVWRPGDPL